MNGNADEALPSPFEMMILMHKPVYPLLFVFILNMSICACMQVQQQKYMDVKGDVHVIHTGKVSHYKWDFHRNIEQKLNVLGEIHYKDGNLTDIQFNNGTLLGLNYKNATIVTIDTAFKNIENIFQLTVNSTQDRIMSFNYSGSDLSFYDFKDKSIQQVSLPGHSLIYQYNIPDAASVYRVGYLPGNIRIYARATDNEHDMRFDVVNAANGQLLQSYSLSRILNIADTTKTAFAGMVYDGSFTTDADHRYIIYYCSFTGLFLCFDGHTGTFKFASRTVDTTPSPKAGYVQVSPLHKALEITPDIKFFIGAACVDSTLYLLNNIGTNERFLIDKYDLTRNGAYKESMYVPPYKANPLSIAANNNQIVVLYENQSVIRYKMESL